MKVANPIYEAFIVCTYCRLSQSLNIFPYPTICLMGVNELLHDSKCFDNYVLTRISLTARARKQNKN